MTTWKPPEGWRERPNGELEKIPSAREERLEAKRISEHWGHFVAQAAVCVACESDVDVHYIDGEPLCAECRKPWFPNQWKEA